MSKLAAAYKLRRICSWIDDSGDALTVKEVRQRLEEAILELVEIRRAKNPDEDPAQDDSSLTPESTVAARLRKIVADRQAEHEAKLEAEAKRQEIIDKALEGEK